MVLIFEGTAAITFHRGYNREYLPVTFACDPEGTPEKAMIISLVHDGGDKYDFLKPINPENVDQHQEGLRSILVELVKQKADMMESVTPDHTSVGSEVDVSTSTSSSPPADSTTDYDTDYSHLSEDEDCNFDSMGNAFEKSIEGILTGSEEPHGSPDHDEAGAPAITDDDQVSLSSLSDEGDQPDEDNEDDDDEEDIKHKENESPSDMDIVSENTTTGKQYTISILKRIIIFLQKKSLMQMTVLITKLKRILR